jgi:excisionase family DNA binding protein
MQWSVKIKKCFYMSELNGQEMISIAEMARRINVTFRAVRLAVDRGRITYIKNGSKILINYDKAKIEWYENRDDSKIPPFLEKKLIKNNIENKKTFEGEKNISEVNCSVCAKSEVKIKNELRSITESRSLKEYYAAEILKKQNDELEGKLAKVDDMERAAFHYSRIIRDNILSIADDFLQIISQKFKNEELNYINSELKELVISKVNGIADHIENDIGEKKKITLRVAGYQEFMEFISKKETSK